MALLAPAAVFATALTLAVTPGAAHAAGTALGEEAGPLSLSVNTPTAQPRHFTTLPYLDLAGSAASPAGIASVHITPQQGPDVRATLRRSADGTQAIWQACRLFLGPELTTLQIKATDSAQRRPCATSP